MLKQQLKALSNSRVTCTSIPLLLLLQLEKNLNPLQDYCLRARFALTPSRSKPLVVGERGSTETCDVCCP